jgi:hypothetical protein
MFLVAAAATLAIVAQDHASLRASPRASAPEMTSLWQGDVVELRGEQAEYVKVWNYRHERGGYVRRESVRTIGTSDADAPQLLAVMRFLRDTPGSESLGISYAAAYLKALPPRALSAEPFDAIGQMAERLAEAASGRTSRPAATVTAHLEVVKQLGVRMQSLERNGRVQVCYDGEMYRNVLVTPRASAEERARAALALTRPDCIDPNLGPLMRMALDKERGALLDEIDDSALGPVMKSRLHARRAGVWAAIAYERARRLEDATAAAQRAVSELASVNAKDLGEDRRSEYTEAALRVSAVRWGAAVAAKPSGPLSISLEAGEPGQTCITLNDSRQARGSMRLARRCTYGIVWKASAQSIASNTALVLAVQPLEGWRELWVFQETFSRGWVVDVISPGAEDPDLGYVEYAGYAPGTQRLLIAREVRDRGRFQKRFEVLRLGDLAVVREASTPELLRDFGRWQDVDWRRETLALR